MALFCQGNHFLSFNREARQDVVSLAAVVGTVFTGGRQCILHFVSAVSAVFLLVNHQQVRTNRRANMAQNITTIKQNECISIQSALLLVAHGFA